MNPRHSDPPKPASTCCPPVAQTTCCAPQEKAGCCDHSPQGTCGCKPGNAEPSLRGEE